MTTIRNKLTSSIVSARRNSREALSLAFLALLLVCLPSTAMAAGLKPGDPAPEFELPGLDGKPHSLSALRKQGHVLLLFWSVNCHFCHKLIPEFRRVYQQYNGRGVELVAVNVGYESGDDIASYARDNELPYLILNDDERKEEIIEQYALIGTPTFVLVAPDGTIRSVSYQLPALPTPRPVVQPVTPAPEEPAETPDNVESDE
ncbi:MAG TPA: TlpA family protein disulfide reductase [Gammaproteobacteria bacterium]|nr:TlpA family protein disulfide reductase [Gammaproteobacteria bacterium]